MSLRLDWCSHEAARYAVEHWHYSRTMPVAKSVKIGVWEGGSFIGVVIFSWGANPNLGNMFGLGMTEVSELVRVALRAHKAPVTKILAIALKMLKRQSPGVRLIVSYADPHHDHVGGIYQGGNWIYAGETDPEFRFVLDGKVLQRRAYTGKNFGRARMVVPAAAEKVSMPGKHKYLYPLDTEMRKQIEPLAKPYPKKSCVTSIDSDAPGVQSGEGGAIPTVTHHTTEQEA